MNKKNIDIVKQKKGNINDIKIRESLITKFLLPSIIFVDKNNGMIKSYSFLELKEEEGLLYKFKKSLPYFIALKEDLIDKNFLIEDDEFFEVNSNNLFSLQAITEFLNFKFDYTVQKNYYKELFDKYGENEIIEKISLLNNYIKSLCSIFDSIDYSPFDLSSGLTKSFEEYKNIFEGKKLIVREIIFNRCIQLEDATKKIKNLAREYNNILASNFRGLDLDLTNNEFSYQEDMLKFLHLIMEEIKNLFSSVINKIIFNVNKLWNELDLSKKNIKENINNSNEIKESSNEQNKVDEASTIFINEEIELKNTHNNLKNDDDDNFIIEEFTNKKEQPFIEDIIFNSKNDDESLLIDEDEYNSFYNINEDDNLNIDDQFEIDLIDDNFQEDIKIKKNENNDLWKESTEVADNIDNIINEIYGGYDSDITEKKLNENEENFEY